MDAIFRLYGNNYHSISADLSEILSHTQHHYIASCTALEIQVREYYHTGDTDDVRCSRILHNNSF